MLEFVINGQRLVSADDVGVVADTINYLELKFDFSKDWADVIPLAEIIAPDETKITPIIENGIVSADRGINLSEGVWTVSVIGDKYEGGEVVRRITTNPVHITVSASGMTDGEPFHIDIDAASEIIARAASFAAIAEGKVEEAGERITEADKRIEAAKQLLKETEDRAAKAAKDAAAAADAAKDAAKDAAAAADAVQVVPEAVQRATTAANLAEKATGKANDIYAEVKEAYESGRLKGDPGESGKDWNPSDAELDSIATGAAGKLQPTLSEMSLKLDNATSTLEALSITNISGVSSVGGVEYNEIAKATVCNADNFVAAAAPAYITGYTVNTYGEDFSIKTGASFGLLKLAVQTGDVIRHKLAPHWYLTAQSIYYMWIRQNGTFVRKTIGFNGKAADISASDLEANGYTVPSGVDLILVTIFRTYYINDGTQIKSGVSTQNSPGFVEDIVTVNKSATLTAYDGVAEAPVYVPVGSGDQYYSVSADLRIDRYETMLGGVESALAAIIGG